MFAPLRSVPFPALAVPLWVVKERDDCSHDAVLVVLSVPETAAFVDGFS